MIPFNAKHTLAVQDQRNNIHWMILDFITTMHGNSLIGEHELIYFLVFSGFSGNENCKHTKLQWKLQACWFISPVIVIIAYKLSIYKLFAYLLSTYGITSLLITRFKDLVNLVQLQSNCCWFIVVVDDVLLLSQPWVI